MEMTSLKESSSDLSKFIKKSESFAEPIDEIKEEAVNVEAVEVISELDASEEDDVSKPLLEASPVQAPESESVDETLKNNDDESIKTLQLEPNSNEEADEVHSMLHQRISVEEDPPKSGLLERLIRIVYDDIRISPSEEKFIMLFIIFLISFIFVLIILSSCFHSLYYDEYALSRSILTGKVDDSVVYEPGWHFMSPFNEWIKFYKTVHTARLHNLDIYTTDQLKLTASFVIYYSLDKSKIGQLYRNHGIAYKPLIYNICKSELLNEAQKFSIENFRTNRWKVKSRLKEQIAKRLAELYGTTFYDMFIEEIKFDKLINDINLKNTINEILNQKAVHEKDLTLVHQETKVKTNELKNQARVVNAIAKLNSTMTVVNIAKTEFKSVLELEHINGLQNNMENLGFTDEKRKMSFCWMNSLVYNDKIRFYHPNSYSDQFSELSPFNNYISMNVKI